MTKSQLSSLNRSTSGRVILVTGAASGMGRATARLLADEGAAVGLIDLHSDHLEAVTAELRAAGARVHSVVGDVGADGEPEAAVEQVRGALGPIDGLVNNAGIVTPAGIEDPRLEDSWSSTMRINLAAQARFVRAALVDLSRNGDGRIVNVASTEGLGATSGQLPYTVAKHGVIGLTKSLAVELGPRGVTVNCVCPGPIETGMTASIPPAARNTFARRRTAVRRYGDPEEMAHMIVALLSPAASYVTGAVIPVDGGLVARNG